jgi:hypothetical protein
MTITLNGTTGVTTPDVSTTTETLSGGTANGVQYLNGSKAVTTGTALTFDGTNLATTGSATATKLIPTGTSVTGNGMYLPATNSVGISTAGVNAVTIDANQNMGLGVTPSAWGTSANFRAIQLYDGALASDTNSLYLFTNAYQNSAGNSIYLTSNYATRYSTSQYDGKHVWSIAPSGTAGNAITFTQAMTLGTDGCLMVGATTPAQTISTNNYLTIRGPSGQPWGVGPTTSYGNFYIANSGIGVYLANGGTSWSAQSDERTKDIIEPIIDATNKVSTLRAVIGKYKTDKEGVRRAFLIAQDVQAVLPEAVNTQGNGVDTLGLQYTDVIPLLVAAIKEQQAIITQLQADVAALKGTP